MTNELKKEWDAILACSEVYIYGAAKTAEKVYKLIVNMGYRDNVKGFLVTNVGGVNAEELCGLPISDVHCFDNKRAQVLVPHMGIYREQICSLLENLGIRNVCLINRLMEQTFLQEMEQSVLKIKTGWEIYEQKSEVKKEKDKKICEQILDILREGQPDFGGIMPYQSLELIGLEGIRPTEYRVREYGLRNILKKEDDVLDIGCNSGCLDVSIAGMVHKVTGIEYDGSLVKTANLIADHLKISNCMFYNEDFNVWFRDMDINTKYSIIFSFAVHHWLNLSPVEYVTIIDKLLKAGGFLCFESHIYGMDIEFEECYKQFVNLGYSIICEKKIKDDGIQERLFVLFQKNLRDSL